LGKEISHKRNYSEEVAEKIDKEVDKFIQKGFKAAKKIITKNKKTLDKIAKTLMEEETIEQEEFEKLTKQLKPISINS
jgi:cell division protease FtsH